MTIQVNCPKLKCQGTVDCLTCLYKCKAGTVTKCRAYAGKYLEIKDLEIDQMYIEKYGEPNILIPMTMRKRRRRRVCE